MSPPKRSQDEVGDCPSCGAKIYKETHECPRCLAPLTPEKGEPVE